MTALRTILVALAALTLAPQALAQSYIGLGMGQARTGGESDSIPLIVAGWHVGEHLGLEAAYFHANALTGIGVAATARVRIVEGLSIFGKLGVYSVDRETVLSTGGAPGVGTGGTVQTDYGTRGSVGLGLAYSLNERIALRTLAERIDGKDDLDTVTIYSAGIELRF